MLIHAQHGVRHEARLATDLVLGGNILHAVQHEADETVALALDAIHDRLAIGADLAFHAHAERIGMHRGMRASAAAISSLDGMQPTRAQVVP